MDFATTTAGTIRCGEAINDEERDDVVITLGLCFPVLWVGCAGFHRPLTALDDSRRPLQDGRPGTMV